LLTVLVRNVVTSASLMEQILQAADLDVTIARCGFLTDANETEYRAVNGALPEAGSSVSRRSLAHFLVNSACGPMSDFTVFGVSAPSSPNA